MANQNVWDGPANGADFSLPQNLTHGCPIESCQARLASEIGVERHVRTMHRLARDVDSTQMD